MAKLRHIAMVVEEIEQTARDTWQIKVEETA
jgi:hypothetical protein